MKAEALNSLKLPVTVKAGLVGTITLKVPWKILGEEPVIVLIGLIFVLAYPSSDDMTIKEAESARLEAIQRPNLGSACHCLFSGKSWLGSLIAAITGNLKITISSVHVRYEDCVANPGHPFSCGVTLAKLAAVTMDEDGNETIDTSGALDKLRKESQSEEQRQDIYSRFYIFGRDSAAFFMDSGFDCKNCFSVKPNSSYQPLLSPQPGKMPHASYPSTRVSVQVPYLGIHFSPARYHKLMELLNILYSTVNRCNQPGVDNCQAGSTPRISANLTADARFLVWKTRTINFIENKLPCFLVLSGLYVWEFEKSRSYQQYLSMAGRQVFDVAPEKEFTTMRI